MPGRLPFPRGAHVGYFQAAFRNVKRHKAYFFMRQWLQNFAYRVDIRPRIFFLSAAAALAIALLTISFQTLKAALANPVDSLRYE